MREDMFDEDKNDESSTDQTCDAKVSTMQIMSLKMIVMSDCNNLFMPLTSKNLNKF